MRTVQEELETVLSKISDHKITTFCAGRTDKGVHSIGQVIHFECKKLRPDSAWIKGANQLLPEDIAISWVKHVPKYFHARFSAISRCYRYLIYNKISKPSIFLNNNVLHVKEPLNVDKMQQAGLFLIGEKDFSIFRSSQCQSSTPWRNIMYVLIKKINNYIIIDIKANSFLHHMVRKIVGSLIEIGKNYKKNETWISEILKIKNCNISHFSTVKAKGLYLFSVDYPDFFHLPKINTGLFSDFF
ncbi:tRNA pseudouridine synthase A [Candidatus Tachikawaea gelatinosa]|uniref:tRNA pseudouridine synthase A n=1 Tax=Candidatus Tachikawaea gelatinosa TaxID=1410383 RepID=A0A090ALE0_9ENTR|nr:tRNA pseudouridine synthase A [Candidatus Tachikawaea gelatinosa]